MVDKWKSMSNDEMVAAIAEPLGVFTAIAEKDFYAGVVLAALATAESNTMSEDDINKVMEWADTIRIDACLLQLVLTGEVQVRVRDGEVEFCRPNESPDEVGN